MVPYNSFFFSVNQLVISSFLNSFFFLVTQFRIFICIFFRLIEFYSFIELINSVEVSYRCKLWYHMCFVLYFFRIKDFKRVFSNVSKFQKRWIDTIDEFWYLPWYVILLLSVCFFVCCCFFYVIDVFNMISIFSSRFLLFHSPNFIR